MKMSGIRPSEQSDQRNDCPNTFQDNERNKTNRKRGIARQPGAKGIQDAVGFALLFQEFEQVHKIRDQQKRYPERTDQIGSIHLITIKSITIKSKSRSGRECKGCSAAILWRYATVRPGSAQNTNGPDFNIPLFCDPQRIGPVA